jgi:hypothetical protein
VSVLAEQAKSIAERSPDVVALQEVTANSLPMWRAALAEASFDHVASSLDNAPATREPPGPRRTGLLVASRSPLEPLETRLAVPWPETVLSATSDGVELHVAYQLELAPIPQQWVPARPHVLDAGPGSLRVPTRRPKGEAE